MSPVHVTMYCAAVLTREWSSKENNSVAKIKFIRG
jgi:hypothetical protein